MQTQGDEEVFEFVTHESLVLPAKFLDVLFQELLSGYVLHRAIDPLNPPSLPYRGRHVVPQPAHSPILVQYAQFGHLRLPGEFIFHLTAGDVHVLRVYDAEPAAPPVRLLRGKSRNTPERLCHPFPAPTLPPDPP